MFCRWSCKGKEVFNLIPIIFSTGPDCLCSEASYQSVASDSRSRPGDSYRTTAVGHATYWHCLPFLWIWSGQSKRRELNSWHKSAQAHIYRKADVYIKRYAWEEWDIFLSARVWVVIVFTHGKEEVRQSYAIYMSWNSNSQKDGLEFGEVLNLNKSS